ncbi:hypothetical protein V7S79_02910 [Aquirufa sp. ROCK-SH2]
MSNILNIFKEEDKSNILKNLSLILNEKEEVVENILPVWNSIVLASLVKLTRNRIRFSALQNFIQHHPIPSNELSVLLNANTTNVSIEKIVDYGESLMGVLMPDKKSALATAMSQNLSCRSSFVLKGLSLVYAFYGEFLLEEYQTVLIDWKTYVEYFSNYKNSIFNGNVPEKVQKSINEILILSEIYKDSSSILSLSDDSDSSVNNQEERRPLLLQPIVIASLIISLLIASGLYFYFNNKSEDIDNSHVDVEEIIPMDSLNKLNDSLTKAVLDSNRIKNDSLVTLVWPKGKEFQVPQNSALVQIHPYLTDSSQVESLQVVCTEFSFNQETEQIIKAPDYFFKRFVEGLNNFKKVKLKLYTFSENGSASALKRGFMLKNRLVGEGLSPKRIEVFTTSNGIKADDSKPLNSQVVFEFQK